MRNFGPKLLVAITFVVLLYSVAGGQSIPDDSDFQSWHDLQITAPITKKLDLYTVTTIQFGGNLSNVDNTRFGAGITFKPVKGLSVTPFITFMSRRNAVGNYRYEYRTTLRGAYKHQFKRFAVGHRSQFEYRFRPGRNSWRYRPSVAVEMPLPEKFIPGLKAFVAEEAFYDSVSDRFSRNRIGGGFMKSLNEKLSLDIYFLHQGDNFSRPGTVNVIGTTLKLAL